MRIVVLVVISLICAACGSAAVSASSDGTDVPTGDVGALPAEAVLCEDIAPAPGTGALDPTGTPAEFAAVMPVLLEELSEYIFSYGAGGTSSYVGRITLGLNTRDQEVVQSALDLVEPRLLCFELPPADFDINIPEPAILTVEGTPDSEATSLTLLVDDPDGECGHDPLGRVLPPVVEESATEVRITVELERVPWGPATCEGWDPTPITVELSQPLGDRLLTGSP